jgi:hypothetical protein
VNPIPFEPMYVRYRMLAEKRYRPALRRGHALRYSRQINFRTAWAALEYAQAWADRSNHLVGHVLQDKQVS